MADKDVYYQGFQQRFKIVATDDLGNPVLVPYTSPDATGGGGGAVTMADGASVTLGNTADAAWTASGPGTVDALLKAIATVALSTAPAQTFQSNPYLNIKTATTTIVKAAAGVLVGIIINKSGTTDTLTIYDNTAASGTILATITGATVGQSFRYDATMGTGITVVTTGTPGDYTVIFR